MINSSTKFSSLPTIPGLHKKRKYAGQGMVEFALALPILLLVVYGLQTNLQLAQLHKLVLGIGECIACTIAKVP